MVYTQQHHLQRAWHQITSCYLHNDMHNFSSIICLWPSYISLSLRDYLMLILKFYTVSMCLQDVKHFVNQTELTFMQTCVNFFCRKNMTSFLNYVTATLWAPFAWRRLNNICFLSKDEIVIISNMTKCLLTLTMCANLNNWVWIFFSCFLYVHPSVSTSNHHRSCVGSVKNYCKIRLSCNVQCFSNHYLQQNVWM